MNNPTDTMFIIIKENYIDLMRNGESAHYSKDGVIKYALGNGSDNRFPKRIIVNDRR